MLRTFPASEAIQRPKVRPIDYDPSLGGSSNGDTLSSKAFTTTAHSPYSMEQGMPDTVALGPSPGQQVVQQPVDAETGY